MIRAALVVAVLSACGGSNPPPQSPQSPQPQPVAATPVAPTPVEPAAAPPPEALPFDPEKEMPAESVATDATLAVGEEANVKIDARSDIFSASKATANAGRGGKLPAAITLAKGGGHIEVVGVKGRVGCKPGASEAADGGACAGGSTMLTAADAVSGITHRQRTLFLTGVFLADKPGKPAKALDFSDDKVGTTFATLEPALGQAFFIGDGLTGTDSGDRQKFVIPKGATKLYLGYADGFSFQGAPRYYGDNKGGLSVALVQQKQ